MIVQAIRRVTNDAHHNAFTGACWFKGRLFIAYRQGRAHSDKAGRIVVLRSPDGGLTWEHVAVLRGPGDTRDAHLYTDGRRLYAVGFCVGVSGKVPWCLSGCAVTENGDKWTTWAAYEGTGNFALWRPQFFEGRHYCAAYTWRTDPPWSAVHWFESPDGRTWTAGRELHAGEEQPSECYLDFRPDGRATLIMRCDGGPMGVLSPYLCTSKPPYARWTMRKLSDILLAGPAVWTVGEEVYIGGRWIYGGQQRFGQGQVAYAGGYQLAAHTAIFKVVKGQSHLQCTLPSGPSLDHAYLGVARYPRTERRFAVSFYSDGVAPDVPGIDQWHHPDIYWADVLCD